MIYSSSFLPMSPSRWTLSGATHDGSIITVAAGGYASVQILEEDVPIVNANLRLVITADEYTNVYTPTNFAEISVTSKDEQYYNVLCPIVDTGSGIYMAELELSDMEYVEFRLVLRSVSGMRITSCALQAPAGSDNTAIIEELRGELPRLLYDYNKSRMVVGQKEETIALISAWLVKNTDLNGHIQLTYTATMNTVLHIRAKGNEVSELFTPILFPIKAGRGSIGIPHAYLEKKIGYHTFTVSAQVEDGTITFEPRAIIYTIDGGHLASRVMDVGMDVRDIALRRTAEEREPSWIYAIGIDNGVASVRARPYSDINTIAWEPQATLGEATEAAMEFEGEWVLSYPAYRLNTSAQPYYFWTDSSRDLWVQRGSDVGSKQTLATDVVKLTAVRGYTNITRLYEDQGLVVAYIKADGLVYYRNRIIDTINQENRVWDNEQIVDEFVGVAEHITSFRTSDYRIGFNIFETSGQVTTLYTERNWAGIAVRPETLTVAPAELEINFIPIEFIQPKGLDEYLTVAPAELELTLLYADTDNDFTSINIAKTLVDENDEEYENWGWIIELTIDHPIPNLELSNVTVTNLDNSTVIQMASINKITDTVYRLNVSDVVESGINNVAGDLQVNIVGAINPAGYIYIDMTYTFTPINLVPTFIPLPEVLEVRNE